MNTKKELRKHILAMRSGLAEADVRACSETVCEKLVSLDVYREACDICLYMPIRNEIDVTLIIDGAWSFGKNIWLPRIIDNEMDFYRYDDKTSLMPDAKYGILEPQSDIRLCPAKTTLIIMPGAVFSRQRDRIGYGGGYYDRYLSKHPICRTVAVCYDFQITDTIPADTHDIKPEQIISEKSCI